MKVLYITILVLIISACSCGSAKGQQDNNLVPYDSLTQQSVYAFVEEMPHYIGGDIAFMTDFNKHFHYDYSLHSDENIQTKLHVRFVIDKKGILIGARIYDKNADELSEFEKAGLKALSSAQNWQAGMHSNKPVNVILTKVIHIDLAK